MTLDPSSLHLAQTAWPRLVVALAVVGFGVVRARRAARLRLGETPADVVALAVATQVAATLTASAILLGMFGLLHDWSWALLATVAFAFVGIRPRPDDAGPGAQVVAGELRPPSWAFLIALLGAAIGRLIFTLRNPPADWDSFHYHLPLVAHWMQTATVGAPPRSPAVFGMSFPGNGELLQAWLAWATGRETLMAWVAVGALVLLGLAVRRTAVMVGARSSVAEAVALCLALAPGLLQLTLGVRVDDMVAMWFAVAMMFALRARHGATGAQLALVLLALGLLAGTKSNGPIYAVLLLALALAGRGAGARVAALVGHPQSLGLAVLLGGFWMARNAVVAGNPLFPAEVRIGPWVLPGIMSTLDQARTSQVSVWMQGFAGHTTLPKLWGYYGVMLAVLAAGLPAWALLRPGARGDARTPAPLAGARALFLLGLACVALYLVGPFSGSYEPSVDGAAPRLNFDNLRLVAPALVAFAPPAAVGLSRLPAAGVIAMVLPILTLAMVPRLLGHIGPGILLALVAVPVTGSIARRRWHPALGALTLVAVAGALALAVAIVDVSRERLFADAWDGYAERIPNLPYAQVQEVRERAAGRPFAVTGVHAWFAYYGRDFSGRPVCAPVVRAWSERMNDWDFRPEPRAQADRGRWLDNLERMRAALVVVGSPGDRCEVRLPEADWCGADTARFMRIVSHRCDTAYVVRHGVVARVFNP